jgi:hypothetical protein
MIPVSFISIVPKRDINGPDARRYDIRDTIYVSPSGKDVYLGASPDLPKKSLFSVKSELQKLKTGSAKNIEIIHKDGVYSADEYFFNNDTLVYFKHNEGGDDNYHVTFKAQNKNKAIFDNSVEYRGFVEDGGLWKVQIDGLNSRKCNMFGFINDVRSIPARWPKYGCLSQFNTVTSGGVVYMRCKDSTGFLQAILDYYRGGGPLNKIGIFGTLDFRGFTRTNITNITDSLPNIPFQPNTFYIPRIPFSTSSYLGIQIYANQSGLEFFTSSDEPSNLDPHTVCSVEGENTIIKDEIGQYWFFYKPRQDDVQKGIEQCVLRTAKVSNINRWTNAGYARFNAGVYSYVTKTETGYAYNDNVLHKSSTPSSGFIFTSPNNVSLQDLTFRYCMTPITLNTPASGWNYTDSSTVNTLINQYTSNTSITGCHIYNTFSSAVKMRHLKNLNVFKNLIYSAEGSGIDLAGAFDTVIENNIVKNCQQIDTRNNVDTADPYCVNVNGQFTGGHTITTGSKTLSGLKFCNNDISYGGNVANTSTGNNLSGFDNKIYNGGFGANSDMSGYHFSVFSFLSPNIYNRAYRNLIYNVRSNTNNYFLGNLMYIDGVSSYVQVYDNIFVNGQTGILFTPSQESFANNNIFYKTRVYSIFAKGVNASPVSISFKNNIFVPTSGTATPLYRQSSTALGGWVGWPTFYRTMQSTRRVIYRNTSSQIELSPMSPWNGRHRYMQRSGGGTGVYRSPTVLFNGNNWVIGDWNESTGVFSTRVSSQNTSEYVTPDKVPSDSWINLNNSSSTFNYSTFVGILSSTTSVSFTRSVAISSNNNTFWSLLSTNTNPADDSLFLRAYNNTSYSNINRYAEIPDPIQLNDNSLSAHGPLTLSETNSTLGDPLFIDPENFNFNLNSNSPALTTDYVPIDTSKIGVYNTPDDPYWSLSAANLKPMPLIYGNANWSDYETIPYPYDPDIEYEPRLDPTPTTNSILRINGNNLTRINGNNLTYIT